MGYIYIYTHIYIYIFFVAAHVGNWTFWEAQVRRPWLGAGSGKAGEAPSFETLAGFPTLKGGYVGII